MDNTTNNLSEPKIDKRLLSPVDRVAEIFFGLIMALTFTCTISVMESDKAVVKDMLIGAITCNVAWGLVDAIMYLLMSVTENGRSLTIFNFVRRTDNVDKAHLFITEALPPLIASTMERQDIENIRQKLLQFPQPPTSNKLTFKDYKRGLGIFILVFLSTFPVVIPFIFIGNLQIALRISNAIAIVIMFFCGWIWGKHAGRNPFVMGALMSLLGAILVLITILLGG
jgi:VIT1/CCC1 family predicted Fe2+/Mn2+ transporter